MVVWALRNKRRIRSWACAFALLSIVVSAACGGCEGCDEPATPDAAIAAPTADVRVEDEPEVDNTAIATELAEAEAEKISIRVGDSARAVAGELEAMASKKPKPPKPRLKGEPETGKLRKAELNKVFNIHADAMKSCYERSLKRSPGLMGKVRLELLIRSNGKVKNANARGISLRDNNVTSCMERQALTMNFPEPDGGAVRVNKTYSFTPDF